VTRSLKKVNMKIKLVNKKMSAKMVSLKSTLWGKNQYKNQIKSKTRIQVLVKVWVCNLRIKKRCKIKNSDNLHLAIALTYRYKVKNCAHNAVLMYKIQILILAKLKDRLLCSS